LHVVRRPPHRRSGRLGARSAIGLLLVAGVALAGIGASVARAETPAQKITRLRNQAAEVQATIDRMNDQVETVVEQYNANQEALQATLDRQRDTARRLDEARKRLGTAENLMGDRMRAIYMGGPVTGLEQLLEVKSVADAVTVAQYQQTATASDVQAIANVRQSRQELASVAATLGSQRDEQEQLQAKLNGQRDDIEGRLAQQRRFLDRLGVGVKRAVAEDQQRQEELRQQALARKLAAEQAAREEAAREEAARKAAAEKAAREQAAKEAADKAASQPSTSVSSGDGGDSGAQSRSSSHKASSSSPAPTSAARQAVAFARAQLGKPYIWGGNGPTGFDCSGLTMKAWQSAGVSIPRTASQQYTIGRHISGVSNLEPGDLVFFGSPIHHVGMYIGNGMMIEAPFTGAQIRIRSMNRSDYIGATRPTG
jgi:cell wall-associated NlpC family hydrolase